MTVLTLIRHGETEWNRTRRIQGSTDIPLNDIGRQQARDAAAALRARLDADAPVVVVSSDLSRARETAEIIAGQLEVPVWRLYPELRERAYGEAEGLDVDEFLTRWGDWHTAEVPGAEPWPHLRIRGLRALRHVVRDARRETAPAAASVIVVTHGAMIRELIRHATGGELPLTGERLANGSAYSMLYERERLRLLSYAAATA
ncbi:histidine phosphatase family protein [Microbacterium deminutum]|uniref:Phosphatase PhoE n=1 Tax=Microbacterium deminutum TaxID=344164 RepID=A0ABP5BRI8_9MICO